MLLYANALTGFGAGASAPTDPDFASVVGLWNDFSAGDVKGHTGATVGSASISGGVLLTTSGDNDKYQLDAASADFAIDSSEAFTFEWFVRARTAGSGYQVLMATSGPSGGGALGYVVEYGTARGLCIYTTDGTFTLHAANHADILAAAGDTSNEHYVAIGRDGSGNWKAWLDGTEYTVTRTNGVSDTRAYAASTYKLCFLNYSELSDAGGQFYADLRACRLTIGTRRTITATPTLPFPEA